MARPLELPVVLIPDEDGGFVVECPVIPGTERRAPGVARFDARKFEPQNRDSSS